MKITAIMSGGDWSDAGVDFVIMPEGSDWEVIRAEYKEWYARRVAGEPYYGYIEWLIKFKGATQPTCDQLEEVWDIN